MSPKRALMVLAFALATGSVGSAVIAGTSASGSPSPDLATAQPTAAVQPPAAFDAAPLQPDTTLQLPTNLSLISQVTGAANLDKTHPVFTSALSKKSTGRLVGTAALSCRVAGLQQICNGAFALRGGVMLVTQTLDVQTNRITGKVTGGSGSFSGAHGTLSGQNKGHGKTLLNISYNLS